MALKAWDQYVKDASREPLIFPLPGGESITIPMPSGQQVADFNSAQLRGQGEDALKALLGARNAAKVIKLGKEAPARTLDAFVADVLTEFGLAAVPNSAASSS